MNNYFNSERRGELSQLIQQLNSSSRDVRKTALKKIIAQMTVGKDLSNLFQHVIKCLQDKDLQVKKLVYLYIVNYSRVKPQDAIMAINNFRRDALNKTNQLIRALAIRTMGYLRVDSLNEYLIQPLTLGLKDTDPYVRKTAVFCIPKLIQVSTRANQKDMLIKLCQDLLAKQNNHLVLANLVAVLRQLQTNFKTSLFKLDSILLNRLLNQLNDCMQWGQVFVLQSIIKYIPSDQKEAEYIIEKIIPRLNHLNPTVVFSCIKAIFRFLQYINKIDLIRGLCKKVAPSLISLVNLRNPEVQWVILRNIHYIVERWPQVVEGQIKAFYVKYQDPFYIKHQKLDIMVRIVNQRNFQQLLSQLKQYLSQPDPQYVNRTIKAISKIAVRFDKSVQKALTILSKYMLQVNQAQSASQTGNQLLCAVQNILRKYPSRFNFNGMFGDVINLMLKASSPEALNAAVWINGQYAQEIYPQSIYYIKSIILKFANEAPSLQLQILTSAVKVFIKYPQDGKQFIIPLLIQATQKVFNVDVRDRAFIYWRLLSSDPQITKRILFSFRPNIQQQDALLQPQFLQLSLLNMGLISSIFQKRPQQIFPQSLIQKLGNAAVRPLQILQVQSKSLVVQKRVNQQIKIQQDKRAVQTNHKKQDLDLLGSLL